MWEGARVFLQFLGKSRVGREDEEEEEEKRTGATVSMPIEEKDDGKEVYRSFLPPLFFAFLMI